MTAASASARRVSPQFSLGKSFPGFGPIGPWLVTVDEFSNPDDLELGCSINGETVQHARTRDLVFSVPQLIRSLSTVLPLLPGRPGEPQWAKSADYAQLRARGRLHMRA